MDAVTLYDSLSAQASQGGWINGFSLREITTDPWGIGVFDPEVVLFEKPPDRRADVEAAREVIFSLGRSMFIENQSWERLGVEMARLYNDPKVIEFLDIQQGNLFVLTPHVQFHDLGIVAAKSLEVRQHLRPDHPLYNDGDPAHRQHIIANRVLTMLEHPLFTEVLGLPVLEGLMLAIADVVTTVSANGSARLLRKLMGRDEISALNAHTRSQVSRRSTHGGNIFFIAPSGSQARLVEVDAYSKALVIEEVSKGTSELTDGSHGPSHASIRGVPWPRWRPRVPLRKPRCRSSAQSLPAGRARRHAPRRGAPKHPGACGLTDPVDRVADRAGFTTDAIAHWWRPSRHLRSRRLSERRGLLTAGHQ